MWVLSQNTQYKEPKKVIGIAKAIPVTVARLAFRVPGPRNEFVVILTERLTIIAIE